MTEGIIQKVFDEMRQDLILNEQKSTSPVWKGKMHFCKARLDEIEQELIKKIDDAIECHTPECISPRCGIKRILIGETKE